MHAIDYLNCSKGIPGVTGGAPYCPNLAALGHAGISYTNTSTSKPSDSFPGLMSIVSGTSASTLGIFYDVAYDRSLAPPAETTGNGVAAGACTPGVFDGTRTEYEEGIDIDQTQLNGGAPSGGGGINSIDPTRLPRDPTNGYTAWSDKHPSYSSASGPGNGDNVDDYYSSEINSIVVPLPGIKMLTGFPAARYPTRPRRAPGRAVFRTSSVMTRTDASPVPVPNLFGMNFQTVSVGQKLIEKGFGSGGYTDAFGTNRSAAE
jgi:hypothetical protein